MIYLNTENTPIQHDAAKNGSCSKVVDYREIMQQALCTKTTEDTLWFFMKIYETDEYFSEENMDSILEHSET